MPAIFTVNSAGDGGAGSGNNGDFRYCINKANTTAGADTINFAANMLFATVLLGSELSITEAVTINESNLCTISGNNTTRIFNTSGAPAGAAIVFNDMNLSNGKSATSGGAIYADDEAVTLFDCYVASNTSAADGGAINVQSGGTLSVNLCYFTSNAVTNAGGDGGAINLQGASAVTIQNSTITGNTSADDGGGIYFNNGGSLLLENSTANNNKATSGEGGSLYFFGTPSASGLIVRNSTITANVAGLNGGAIAINNFNGTLKIQNSTLTQNTAINGNGGAVNRGGTSSGTIAIDSSILYSNVDNNLFTHELNTSGTVTANASLIRTTGGVTTFTGDAFTNANIGVNPQLGPLQANGGVTYTQVPASNSKAIDNGSNPLPAELSDQRGGSFVRVFGAQADIGAIEVQNSFTVTNANNSGPGSLRDAFYLSNSNPGADAIYFDANFFSTPQTIKLFNKIDVVDSVSVFGPGTGKVTIDGQNNRGLFLQTNGTGAAIWISGLTFTNCSGGPGSAIYIDDESVNIYNCVFTDNNAGAGASPNGGAIYVNTNAASLYLDSCTLSNNSASYGGAIYCGSGAQQLYFTNCTLMNNTASSNGGGMYISGTISNGITLRNDTLYGNSSAGTGGAVRLYNTSAASFFNCTLVNNTGTSAGGGIAFKGAGVNLVNSIVSGNISTTGPDLYSYYDTANVNFCALGSSKGFIYNGANNLPISANLKLGAPANNGGPTQTILPALDSPVVDQGQNQSLSLYDQRGTGYFRIVGAGPDIGAVEAFVIDNTPPIATVSVNSKTINDFKTGGSALAVTVNYNEAMNTSVTPTIAFPVENPFPSISFSSGSWLNVTSYQALYNVSDYNVAIPNVDVRVTGGKDYGGNTQIQTDTADVFSIDTQNPLVLAMNRNNPTLNNLTTVGWTVVFSEPVTGLSASNFALFNGGLGGVPMITSVLGGGTTWIVQASNYAGEGNLGLYMASSAGVVDAAGNPVAALPVVGPNYAIDPIAPRVFDVQVNDGSVQRSRVTSVSVKFLELVNFVGAPANAFTLTGPNGSVTLAVDLSGSTAIQTVAKLTFSGPNTDFTSLKDGRYTLAITAAKVTDLAGNPLDGDGDGIGGDNYSLVGNPSTAPKLFRLYGDVDGNGLVDGVDFGAFRNAFNTNNFAFDFDGSGIVDGLDFGQFRQRFGMVI